MFKKSHLLAMIALFGLAFSACVPPSNLQPSPSPVPSASPAAEAEANITVSEPQPNQLITFPFTVKGEARVFENVLSVALLDGGFNLVSEKVTQANSPDVGQFGPFTATFTTKPSTKTGFIKVFSHSAKDGSEINLVLIPVRF
jgi:hypothetical protein